MRVGLLGFSLLLTACASSPDRGPGNENRNVLTREEMLATDLLSLEELVHRQRPEWFLRERPGWSIPVFGADLQLLGLGLGDFHNWREAGVHELEFIPEKEAREALANDPQRRYRRVVGAIIIRFRPGRDRSR
jgi:hypothetical protein